MLRATVAWIGRGRDQPSSQAAEIFRKRGVAVWDGAVRDIRQDFPREVEQLRIVQYDSCRGLEGWTVFALRLDDLWQYKRQQALGEGVGGDLLISPDEAADRRMGEREELAVRLCVDIARRPGDTSHEDGILARFRTRLVQREWPGPRLPEVFYDPRALAQGDSARASLHAKCVVIDGRIAFVGSANLTEAAQRRNIEVGLVVRSATIAGGIEQHMDALIARDFLRRLAFS